MSFVFQIGLGASQDRLEQLIEQFLQSEVAPGNL